MQRRQWRELVIRSVGPVLLPQFMAAMLAAQAGSPAWPAGPLHHGSAASAASVRNVPLSAYVITEYDRVLAYGGHIHREMRGKIFRDSEGRVRTETEQQTVGGIERSERIIIQDPIQRVVIHLDPHTKTATITPIAQRGSIKDPLPQPGPPAQPLGTRVIDGFAARGTRTTLETSGELLPNGQPAVSVTESWFSPDLLITLYSQTNDNQQGRDTMKVVQIVRSEPDSQLFQIPAGYAVKQSVMATASAKP